MNDTALEPAAPREEIEQAARSIKPAAVMIYPLQYLRAIAAFSVVLCHASYYVMSYRGDDRMWPIFGRFGAFGVTLFFAISGYLMAHLAATTGPTRFLAHRLIRIYPIYWLCVLGVVLIGLPFGRVAIPETLAMLLVPGVTRSYVLGVECTLPFELTFYLIVFLVILVGLRKRLPTVAIIWIAVIELFFALRPSLQRGQFPMLLHLPFSLFSLAFAMGLLVPYALDKRWIGPATPIVGFGLLIASEAMATINTGLSTGLMAFGCALFVATAVQAGGEGVAHPNRALVALGDWSYALYLCHVPVIMALCYVMPHSVPTMPLWFAAIGLPLVVAAGVGKIDLAMYRHFKSLVDRSELGKKILCGLFLAAMMGFSAFAYVHVMRTRIVAQDLAPLAVKIESTMAGDGSKLAIAAEQAGLHRDDAVKGHFDGVYPSVGKLRVAGWGADTQAQRPVRVLVFRCGHYEGLVLTGGRRPDVAKSLQIASGSTGFVDDIETPRTCPTGMVQGLLTTDDHRYSIISAPPTL